MANIKYCILALATMALASCMHPQPPMVMTGTLYPANRKAQDIGPLNLQFTYTGLSGPVFMMMPNGEAVTGQYSVVDNSVSGSVSSINQGIVTGKAKGSVAPGARSGRMAMIGEHGLSGSCDFMMNRRGAPTGNGTCKFSNGAEYNLMF